MQVPRVLTIRELRDGLAEVVRQAQSGQVVYAGAQRKPEVVIMAVEHYESLTEQHEHAIRSEAGSFDMEGMRVPEDVRAHVRDLLAGRIDFEEYRRRVIE